MRAPYGKSALEFERLSGIVSDDCVLWPYAVDGKGYGVLRGSDGKLRRTHRMSCIKHYGPSPDKHVAHSCRNRHCLNPRHLRWATPTENMRDKIRDGTHMQGSDQNGAKLTADQVLRMRELRVSGTPVRDIAAEFGVHVQTTYKATSGASWAWLS